MSEDGPGSPQAPCGAPQAGPASRPPGRPRPGARARAWALLFPGAAAGRWARRVDVALAGLVVVSLATLALGSIGWVADRFGTMLHVLDAATTTVFAVEYAARLWACADDPRHRGDGALRARRRWATSPSALADLVALLPALLEALLPAVPDLRVLRVFRLLRLFRLGRNAAALVTLGTVVRREAGILVASGYVMLLLLVLTACLGWLAEHDAQPQAFGDIPSALYWAAMTLSSIGYGDLAPVTPIGRALTILMSLVGIGLFAFPAGVLAAGFGDQLRMDREAFGARVRERVAADPRGGTARRALERALRAEADRLHVDPAEVAALVAAARHARARERVEQRRRRWLRRGRTRAGAGPAAAAGTNLRAMPPRAAGTAAEAAPGTATRRMPAPSDVAGARPAMPAIDPAVLEARPELAFEIARLRIRELVRLAIASGAARVAETDDPVARRLAAFGDPADPVERRIWRAVRRAASG